MKCIHTEQPYDALRCFKESRGIDPLVCDGYVGKGLEIGNRYTAKGKQWLSMVAQGQVISYIILAFMVWRKGAMVVVLCEQQLEGS